MKLVRFGPKGEEAPGLVDDSGHIRSLEGIVGDIDGASLQPHMLDRLRRLDPQSLPKVESEVRIGACVARPGKIIGIGLNYADHAEEAGMTIPTEAPIFMKATSAMSGPFDDVVIPPGSKKTDWEVELAFIIGRAATHVAEERAMDHVAGYCIMNDVSERHFQLECGGQWDKGKGCDTFAPTGPWLVTADEVPDPQALRLWLELDGYRYQNGSTETMIFPVRSLVSYLSRFMTLEPGDIVITGTPPGVGLGQRPPVYLRAGQTMRLGIDGLGEQRQRLVQG
jgi:2-keto-4-pentenoate hydratase/2-oxohepta-3-ene-1,7-dioic acid hydratase in catechol pathway